MPYDFTITTTTRFHQIECWVCGVNFAITSDSHSRLKENGKTFFCPHGCRIAFGESKKDKEIRELKASIEARDRSIEARDRWLTDEKRSHAATKGQLTKTKKRIKHGVCPCCNRQFQNLQRHMENKHPDFVEKVGPDGDLP